MARIASTLNIRLPSSIGFADSDRARAELAFQSATDAFHHRSLCETLLFGRREREPFAIVSLGDFAPSVTAPQVLLYAFKNGTGASWGARSGTCPRLLL